MSAVPARRLFAWSSQFADAVDYDSGSGLLALLLFLLSLPWKLTVAFAPPPRLLGGWACFVVVLGLIGVLTALIGDVAAHMGCCMGLQPSITAITFVALGTSLPDTFASMQAAVGDKYADNSIGNVTGSNSVNVLLGLGLPWLIGAAYWAAVGSSDQWLRMYGPGGSKQLPKSIYEDYRDKGGFYVSKSGLGLSVVVFICTAVATISIILLRRFKLNPPAELGGDKKLAKITAGFLVFLWFVYIGMSCLAEPGFTGSPAIADPF